MSYDYSYDANGNITEIKQNGKLINKYTYDSLNEVKEEYDYVNKFYINYSYDGAGNLQNKYEQVLDPTYGYPTGTQHGNTYEYTDTSWKDKLTKINGDNITYDANGNPLTYRDGMSFEWENGRILKKINTSDKSVQMSYDSNGMRTQKSVDGVKTNYYYDSNKNLIALVKGNDTLLFYYDSDGSATSFSYNGTMYFYVKNLQGDVIRIIDLAGTEVASYVYDAWGNIKDTKGEPTIREINPIRYRGYVYDTETSLYYLQSRYYDPFAGRFLNADIYCDTGTSTPLSTNMFAYCENNIINKIDPSGYWVVSAGLEGGAAAILGLYLAVGVGFDGTNIAITLSVGMLIITNASAYISGYFAYYPNKKSVKNLSGWGASVGCSFSLGVHLSGGAGFEFQSNGHGFSGSIGAGASIAPIPYFQVKFGYTWVWYWNIKKTKNNQSYTKSIWWIPNSKIKLTKTSNYTNIYVYKFKKTIRVYYKSKRIKVY